jgi:hypothetical protein
MKKSVLQKCRDHVGKAGQLTAIQSVSLDLAIADVYPAEGVEPNSDELDVVFEFEWIGRPPVRGLPQTPLLKKREVLTHRCMSALVQSVTETPGKKPVIRLIEAALLSEHASAARAPAALESFEVFFRLEGETTERAWEAARSETVGEFVKAIARSLKRPDLAGLSDSKGVLLRDGESCVVLFEKSETYVVGSRNSGPGGEGQVVHEADGIFQEGLSLMRTANAPRRAAELLRRAAALGHPDAMAAYGECLQYARGVLKNVARAADCYRRGSEAGSVWALAGLAELRIWGQGGEPKDEVGGLQLAREAAAGGSARGMLIVGLCFHWGRAGVARDYGRALWLWEKAAELGCPAALVWIGFCHEFGAGVKQDRTAALAWYTESTKHGEAAAFVNLAFLLERGEGGPEAWTEARRLYRIGRELGGRRIACGVGMRRGTYEC